MKLKIPKAVWIPGASIFSVAILGGFWSSRLAPPIPLLQGARPAIVKVEADRLNTGEVRKIYVYRFEKNYFEQLDRGMTEMKKVPGWEIDGGGEDPDWAEFQSEDESLEFVNDVPTDITAKSNGVTWSPAKKTGRVMTVIYTRPASGLEFMLHEISAKFSGKP